MTNRIEQAVKAPKCPYPSGTEEYEDWWSFTLTMAAHEAGNLGRQRQAELRELGRLHHHHRFIPGIARCLCGMTELQYHATEPMRRTTCPLSIALHPMQETLMRLPPDLHDQLWTAVNAYAEARGAVLDGTPGARVVTVERMSAVSAVERAVTAIREDDAKRARPGKEGDALQHLIRAARPFAELGAVLPRDVQPDLAMAGLGLQCHPRVTVQQFRDMQNVYARAVEAVPHLAPDAYRTTPVARLLALYRKWFR